MFDPISDMFTRIRNAQRAGHEEVMVPFSKLKMAIARILEKENFVELVRHEKAGSFDDIRINLKYVKVSTRERKPVISGIDRVSKTGQRRYLRKEGIRKVKNGYGIAILSTSRGVMTGQDARTKGLGGEYLCKVW